MLTRVDMQPEAVGGCAGAALLTCSMEIGASSLTRWIVICVSLSVCSRNGDKQRNRALPCCAWRASARELWGEDSRVLEGIHGQVVAEAGFEALWICL